MSRAVMLLLYDAALVSLAIEDFRKRKISNHYVVGILLLALVAAVTMPEVTAEARFFGMFAVSVPMILLALFMPGSFGGGDIKLAFGCGAFLGVELLIKGTVIAIFLAGLHCIWLICIKKERRNVQFALGPFLSAGYIISSLSLF